MNNIFPQVVKSFFKGHTSYIAQVRCKDRKTLDIGCGFGSFLKYDPKNFVGIEINDQALEYCQKKGFKVEKINANRIPFENESFDRIVALQVIEHLSIDDAYKMLLEAQRVLKKDGELILSTEMATRSFWNTFSHVKPYPPKSLLKLMKRDNDGLETFEKIRNLQPVSIYYSGKFHRNRLLSLLSQIAANYLKLGTKNYTMIISKK